MKNKIEISIRQEEFKDRKVISSVIKESFSTEKNSEVTEHLLVEELRETDAFIPQLSLVATYQDKIIGHILLSKIKVGPHTLLALAPLAVIPKFQKMGVGTKLILRGHEIAKRLNYKGIIVLGHPSYYPRFGYKPASSSNIKAPFNVKDEVFMAIELKKDALKAINGTVKYPKEFGC